MAFDGIHGVRVVLPTEGGHGPADAVSLQGPDPSGDVGFGRVFDKVVGEANAMSSAADAKAQALAAGVVDDLHGTMIAQKEAEITVKLVGSIRNKVLDAFHEIWRTSV